METWLTIVAPGAFALGGVVLSSFLERWRRKEHLLKTIFDKKVEAYSRLVREAHKISINYIIERKESLILQGGLDLLRNLGEFELLCSPEVSKVAFEFAAAAGDRDTKFENKGEQLGALYRELRSRCQEELGIADLQKNLVEK